MKIFKTPDEVINWKKTIKSIGFVPTMGSLHEGHLSLVKRSLLENTYTLVSLFLNPTQFDNQKDLDTYPQDLICDLKQLKKINVDAVFTPRYKDMYPDDYKYKVMENDLSQILCGKMRKGHFESVLTIVLKLLHIVQPDQAYFGEKDYQQLQLIEGLVKAFFLNVQIVKCPTVREASGLALSSRNRHLSPEGKLYASKFFQILRSHSTPKEIIQQLEEKNFKVDYVEERANRRYGAVFYEGIRLIDNVEI